jgi:hypothetical protein
MAYITTAEVKEIRLALKKEFGKKFKFSVSRRDGGLAVSVAIMAGEIDFSKLWDGKAPEDYGYGYQSINEYHITEKNYGEHVALFKTIDGIIRKAPANAEGGREYFDKSDSMTDYFHTAFYYDMQVGKWDRPYVQQT